MCVEAGVSPLTAGAGTPDPVSTVPHTADTGLVAIHDAGSGDQLNMALTLLSLCHGYAICVLFRFFWKTLTRVSSQRSRLDK